MRHRRKFLRPLGTGILALLLLPGQPVAAAEDDKWGVGGSRRSLDARPEAEVSAAAITAGADQTGEVSHCQGDIESFAADYNTNGGRPVAAFGLRTRCLSHPATTPPWTDGYSFAGWLVDVNGDDREDFEVFFANDGDGLFVDVYRIGAEVPVCEGSPVVDGQNIFAVVDAGCLGSPASFRVNAGLQYDRFAAADPECGTCTFDEAPEGAWGPPTVLSDSSAPPPGRGRQGYWMIGRTGDTYSFGAASHHGNTPAGGVVDLEPTPTGNGYWTVDARGGVYTFGDARYRGGVGGGSLAPGETVTAISATPSGNGYWVFTSRGTVRAFGDAPHLGDMSAVRLNGPVLDSIPTPSGRGYYMVGSDGGIFTFGDAAFHGSMGDVPLNAPVQSLVPDPDGAGYWLVASDGGIFAFQSEFYGSMGDRKLNKPVTGMVGFGRGYLMVGEDGGIFTFGDAPFFGSLGDNPPAQPIVSVAILDGP